MKKRIRVLLCVAALIFAAAGCKKTEGEEMSQVPTEAVPAEIPEASVTLGEYKGIQITDVYEEVTDEDLEHRIQQILEANPVFTEVDRPAENGDVVNIDYVGKKDGVPFDRGADDNFDLTLGSHTFIDGFEEGLLGAKTGDKLDLNLTFPENYGSAELAGQDVVFEVTVNAVKEKSDAVLDDAFVQSISEESKTVDEYRTELRRTMEEEAREAADLQMQNEAVEKVIANATFVNLDEQVDAELKQQVETLESTLMLNQQMTLDEYAALYATDADGLKEQLRQEIQNALQVNLIADAIADAEGIEADDAARQKLADFNYVEDVTQLVSQYGQEAVNSSARRIRVLEFLVENAVVQ